MSEVYCFSSGKAENTLQVAKSQRGVFHLLLCDRVLTFSHQWLSARLCWQLTEKKHCYWQENLPRILVGLCMANSLDFLWENRKENSAFLDKKNVLFFFLLKNLPRSQQNGSVGRCLLPSPRIWVRFLGPVEWMGRADSCKLPSDLCIHAVVCACEHTCKINTKETSP